MKYLFALAILVGLPVGTLAQETVLRQTKLSPDVRYEVIVWSGSYTLRLDKHTGAVDILTDGPRINGVPGMSSWEPVEIKRTPLEGPTSDPVFAVSAFWSSPRFQILSYGSRLMLFDTMNGRLWIGEAIGKARTDGLPYRGLQWRPVIDEPGERVTGGR